MEEPSLAAASSRRSVTRTLQELGETPHEDRGGVEERLYEQVYDELRGMARGMVQREVRASTLRPTELVHEVYLRLFDAQGVGWDCRAHFFGAAARAMRRILVDQARRRIAAKRGRGWQRVTLADDAAISDTPLLDVLAVHEALERLTQLDPRMAQIVEMRIFGGMTIPDIAAVISVSARTVEDDWAVAKKWLRRELSTA